MRTQKSVSVLLALALVGLCCAGLARGSETEPAMAIQSEIARDLADELQAVSIDELDAPLPLEHDALLEADAEVDADADSESQVEADVAGEADAEMQADAEGEADTEAETAVDAAADSEADSERRRRWRWPFGRKGKGRRRGGAAQRYNPGDRVQITIKHKIKALCARKRRGSKTVYTGRICPNGNIQWEGMRTLNPRRGLSPSACQWSRQGAAAEWVNAWVGDCDRAPTQVPQLRFLKPKRYRNLVVVSRGGAGGAGAGADGGDIARPSVDGVKDAAPATGSEEPKKQFPPPTNQPPTPGAEAYDCFIKQSKCPNYPQYVGQFKDPFTQSYTQSQCFARAKWFHAYCGNSDYVPTTAVWGKTGQSYKHQIWHTGDRVQLAVQHNIPALCGRITGSTTVYYGSICANGNIQWEWMRTNDPPTGFTSRQCTWRKAASSDYAWIMQWFGDCDTAPTMVPGIKKLHPNKYPAIKREWYRAGDKVQYELVTRARGLCAKPSGSKVQFLGTICEDGKSVEWQRVKVLDPRPGMNPKECSFRRDNAPKHVLSLYLGKCSKLPKDLPEMKSTIATELLPGIRRGWFKPGDEVYTVIKTKIGALCAAATGSTTTYKGVVCENGNVQWNSMSTSDPRPPYTTAQCSWSRAQTTSKKWLDMWLGSCNAPPPGVPQLSSADPGDLPAVLQDKNTCTKNTCSANAVCTRVFPSSHTCQCKPGFQGDGVNCGEIDNCASNPCHKQAYCKKTGPGQHKCECHPGFAGDGVKCEEVDNCAKNPCDANAECKKTGPGAHVCECNKGFHMQNNVCTEINACALQPCDPNATCKKTGPGTYSCTCNKGYIGDGKFCREKNDCDRTPAPCSAYAKCTRTGPGKHKCECKAGYRGDGLTCEEVDACAAKPCDKHGVCRRTGPGKHVCTCVPGYKKKKGFKDVCEEVNNCDKKPCDKNAKCKKTGPGMHVCTCKRGFKGDGMTCDPIDACESHPCPLNSICRKTGPGAFACQCKSGYRRKGQLCVEKDGCASNPCDPRAKCHKTGPGTHVCVCAHGYKMVGNKCEEIDACEKNPCSTNSDCQSTGPNKYKCVCKKGFTGDGVTCKEVDACEMKPSPCDKNADCTKTGPGLFKCSCRLGYTGSGVKCEEANPCIPNNPCDKNAFCTKTGPGKYSCQCNKGFTKFGDSCLEVDACLSHPCDRNADCDRTGPGTFGCRCKQGFEGNGFVCAEINACLSSPCDKHAYCQRDGPNKYKCLCQRGYKMGAAGVCEEINACKQVPYPCDQHATCTSTGPNAFLCSCKVGFQMNQKNQCEEVDPCASNPCERTAICTAVRSKIASPDGEYRLKAKCSCMPGYKANLEGKCVAVDPCASSPCDVHAVCQKTGLEDFTCRCKPGYVMNAKTQTCDEIDACVSKPCPLNSLCIKTGPALFTCVCNAGYKMDKKSGMCMEADSCLSGPCGAHAICQKTGPGTHTCNCVPGFVMEGTNNCVADDNLMTRQLKASANEARAKKQLEDELEAQRRKLELEKLAELAALRQKEELRRFGDRLDAFLRQRRVKREFAQDNTIDEIQARIGDLEHAAEVLVKNSEQQSALARQVLAKKQAEHHVVARKQLIQHKHDSDLLALMKRKVDEMLSKAREEADSLYKAPVAVHGYNPTKPKPAPAAAPAPAPAAPPKPAAAAAATDAADASLFEDESEVSLLQVPSEAEQQIMVDAKGTPVLPMSEPVDLNAPLDPIMAVPASDAAPQPPQSVASASVEDLAQDAPTQYPRFVSAEDAVEEDSTEELGSVSPVEQVAELPTPQSVAEQAEARFQQTEADAQAQVEEAPQPTTFQPEMSDARLNELPLEAELV